MTEGEGERALRTRWRRKWGMVGGLSAVLLGTSAMLRLVANDPDAGFPPYPPEFAVFAAVVFVTALFGGTWLFLRRADEFEVRVNLEAFTFGLLSNMAGFAAWALLWLGGLVREPHAATLFFGTGVATLLAYLAILVLRR